MKFSTLLLFILGATNLISQDSSILVKRADEHKNDNQLSDKAPIPLTELSFSEDVYHFYLDSLAEKIYLRTREVKKNRYKPNGHISSLDLEKFSFDWQERINFNKTISNIKNRYLIRQKPAKNVMVDLTTGKELWEIRNQIVYTFTKLGVVIGYKLKPLGGNTSQLQGLDIATGRVIWERELERKFGWRETFAVSDSTIIVSGSGVHLINCKTGGGWSIDQKTGKDKANFWVGKKRYFNLGSNIVGDTLNQNMYQANESIIKFNMDGESVWESDLPVDKMSKMFLFNHQEYLYLLNTGGSDEASLGYSHIGQAYIAKINKSTGDIVILKDIVLDKKDYIYDFKFVSDEQLDVLTKSKLIQIHPSTGEILHQINLATHPYGKFPRFTGTDPYLFENGVFVPLLENYSFCLFNGKEMTYHFIKKTNQFHNRKSDDLWFKIGMENDMSLFLGGDKSSYIVDKTDSLVAELNVLGFPYLLGDRLYSKKDKKLFIHDLSKIID